MKVYIAVFFSAVLTLPYLVGLSHFINDHHEHCHIDGVHLHDLDSDCLTCDYLRTGSDYKPEIKVVLFYQLSNPKSKNNLNKVTFISEFINYFDLRGPPSVC